MEFLNKILRKGKQEGGRKVAPYKPDYSATTAEPNPFTDEPTQTTGDQDLSEHESWELRNLRSKVDEFLAGAVAHKDELELSRTIEYTSALDAHLGQTQLSPEIAEYITDLQAKIKKEEFFRSGDDLTIKPQPRKPRNITYTGLSVFSKTTHPGVYWKDQTADWQSLDNMGDYGILRKQSLVRDDPRNPSFWGLRK